MRALHAVVLRHRDLLLLLAGVVAFGLAYVQIPLYYSNQNQYFLHGLMRAGVGNLNEDWLAHTVDPAPVFSWLVFITARYFSEWLFYLMFAALAGVYFVSLVAIARVFLTSAARGRLLLVGALVVVTHAFMIRRWLDLYLGWDFAWSMQSGVAGQYVLGPGLQPSVFGVLLVAAVAAYLHGRRFLAAGFIVVGCTFHATYLLPGALLTMGFMADIVSRGKPKDAVLFGLGTLIGVLPVTLFALSSFGSTTPELTAAAQQIMAVDRLPHHALISNWFDWIVGLQLAWLALAIVLAGRRWIWVIGLPAGGAFALSLVQFASGDLGLALLFPWRLSTVLVPVASAIIFARLALFIPVTRWTIGLAVALVAVASSGYLFVDVYWHGSYKAIEPLMTRIAREKQPGELYLIPTGLEQFRLATGAPIYVDRKSIPYLDSEVVEWNQRLNKASAWYDSFRWGPKTAVDQLIAAGINRVVIEDTDQYVPLGLVRLYGEAGYSVYRVLKTDR